jgi:release factor glutamine methyltransferase
MVEFHPLRSLKHDENEEWDAWDQQAVELAASQPTAPLPSLDHLTYQDFEHVYEPAEDTYLLLDALQYELKQIKTNPQYYNRSDAVVCLEIGCGSGVPSVFFRTQWIKEMEQIPLLSYVTDVNPRALEVTQQTFREAAKQAETPELEARISAFEAMHCDLVSALLPILEHKVSFLLFNPPYVPTPDEEVGGTDIEASWAGGVNGRRVIDRAIPQIAQALQPFCGVAYMVTVDDNRPPELATRLEEVGLRMRPLFRRRAKNEFLTIQKITWIDQSDDV